MGITNYCFVSMAFIKMFKKEIVTELEIKAPAAVVWKLITDFSSYSSWNPLILSVKGDPTEGGKLDLLIHLFLQTDMKATPTILKVEKDREIAWKGGLIIPGILDGEHVLQIHEIGKNVVKLVQKEIWSGIMSPVFMLWMGNEIREGFERMNEKVRDICEMSRWQSQ